MRILKMSTIGEKKIELLGFWEKNDLKEISVLQTYITIKGNLFLQDHGMLF